MVKRSIFIIVFIFLVGCSATENKNYVKNIIITSNGGKYYFTVECYEFSTSQENYFSEEFAGENLEQLCLDATAKRNYNYRLCENIYISTKIFDGNFSKIIYCLNRLKIPVTAKLFCYTSDILPNNSISDYKLMATAVFDIIDSKNKVSGFFQLTDKDKNNNGAVLVANGEAVKLLNEKQWSIFNIFTGKIKDFPYTFRDGSIYCKLENCKVLYSFDRELNVDIYVRITDYKGIDNSLTSENIMKDLLKNEIRDTAYELYNDALITDNSNLHWYCTQVGQKCDGVNINVFIM